MQTRRKLELVQRQDTLDRFDLRDDLLQSTPLGWACRWGQRELVELLIHHGAPVREKDAEPWAMPEAWARKMNHDEILAVLERNLESA